MPAPERVPAGGLTPAVTPDGAGPPDDLTLLTHGELTVEGRLREASNAVLYCVISHRGRTANCVYKPVAGERPLWDFPHGTLAGREIAAYLVSEATGWGLIPPTVLRDGPYGEGMVQLWIDVAGDEPDDAEDAEDAADDDEAGDAAEADGTPEDDAADDPTDGGDGDAADALLALVAPGEPGPGWKAVVEAEIGEGRRALLVHADDPRLRRLAVLDAVINNADRKGGHLLPAPSGQLYGIDHGVTFHTENKLRTLLWGWAGEPLTDEATEVLGRLSADLSGPLGERLAALLTAAETAALRERVTALLASGRHPDPGTQWPTIPWPPV